VRQVVAVHVPRDLTRPHLPPGRQSGRPRRPCRGRCRLLRACFVLVCSLFRGRLERRVSLDSNLAPGRAARLPGAPGPPARRFCSGLNHTPRGLDSQGGDASLRSHKTARGDTSRPPDRRATPRLLHGALGRVR
jgi:hypothetical protein